MLLPEKSTGVQVNYRYQFNPKILLTANSYFYHINNYIERYQLTEHTRSYRNTDKATIKGFELSALWEANEQLQSTLSYQWQQGKDNQQRTIDDGLPTALKWMINYQPSTPVLKAFSFNNQVSYRFNKSTFGPSEQLLEKAIVWHSSVKWAVLASMDIKLTFSNITNSDYRSSSDEEAPLQPQRSINISWQWYY
jgi:iron complex outermembrane receptor protein